MENKDELLLNLYISCPALYDKKHAEYSKAPVIKENLWKAISSQLNVPVAQCQIRIKQLRDRYNREKKREADATKSGAGASQGSSWSLMQLCSFWGDHVKPRNTVSSMAMKQVPSQASPCPEHTPEADQEVDDPDEEFPNSEGPSATATAAPSRKRSISGSSSSSWLKKRRLSDDSASIIENMSKVADAAASLASRNNAASAPSDEEAIFAQYVVAAMRAIPEDLRDDLRIEMMQLIRSYKAQARI